MAKQLSEYGKRYAERNGPCKNEDCESCWYTITQVTELVPPRPTFPPRTIYVVGSLRNPSVMVVAEKLRSLGWTVFDDWQAAGPEADDYWQRYETARGHNMREALEGHAARHVYNHDKAHLDSNSAAILVLPAGKSGHLELGYMIGQGKPGYILMDKEPERFDVMYKFATGIFYSIEEMAEALK